MEIAKRTTSRGQRPLPHSRPRSFPCGSDSSGPYSVIPAKAEPALDSIRGIHVHRNETAEEFPEAANISGDLQPIKMDPGSSPGVTGTGATWIRPAFFSVIPGLTRNPWSLEQDGGRPFGIFTRPRHPLDHTDRDRAGGRAHGVRHGNKGRGHVHSLKYMGGHRIPACWNSS
jgi:hypothetical protein